MATSPPHPPRVPGPPGLATPAAGPASAGPERRIHPGAVALVVAAVTLLQLPALLSPLAGAFHDDGIYLVTARALAEGRGYLIDSLPEPIPQTKYPVLFPALLAAVWKIAPDFPANLPFLRLVPLAATWLWIAMLWRLIAVELGRPRDARIVAGLTIVSPATLYYSTQLLAETLFAAIATGAVLLMVRMHAGTRPITLRTAAGLAVICALAFHARTIGLALLVPAAWVLLGGPGGRARYDAATAAGPAALPRKAIPATAFALVWLALCAPWYAWQAAHPVPPDPVLAYYTHANYAGWNLVTGHAAAAGDAARVILGNAMAALAMPFWMWSFFAAPPLLLLLLGAAAGAAVAVALVRAARGAAAPAALWIAAALAIALLWPWPSFRFLLPVAPLALFLMVSLVTDVLAAPRSRHAATDRAAAVIATVFLAGLGASGLVQSARVAITVHRHDAIPWTVPLHHAARESEIHHALDWIRAHSPGDAIVAAMLDPVIHLHTGRRAIRAFATDPFRAFYAPDAPRGATGTPDDLARLLRHHRVDFLVLENLPGFTESAPLQRQVAALNAARPGMLLEAWRSDDGGVAIYRVLAGTD